MARSSTTRMDRITGVSRLPSRFRSPRTLATIPDEVTYVTPPSTTAASADQPSSSPASRPGVKFRTRSTRPAGAAPQDAQPEDDPAQLEEDGGAVVHAVSSPAGGSAP